MKYAVMILVLSATCSAAADDEASKRMLKDLEGSYKVTALETSGKVAPKSSLDKHEKITIKDDKLTIIFKGQKPMEQTITVNANKKPAHIDLTQVDGPGKGLMGVGIITVEGDTIKICDNGGEGGKRPTEFKTTKENGNVLMTLKKIKE